MNKMLWHKRVLGKHFLMEWYISNDGKNNDVPTIRMVKEKDTAPKQKKAVDTALSLEIERRKKHTNQ